MSEELKDNLSCAICLEIFDNPLVLPCQHSLCEKCIDIISVDGNVQCPSCRKEFNREEMRGNFLLQNIVDSYRKEKKELKNAGAVVTKKAGDLMCELCEMVATDVFFCQSCSHVLCRRCNISHVKISKCTIGETMDFYEMSENCRKDLKRTEASVLQEMGKIENKKKSAMAENYAKQIKVFEDIEEARQDLHEFVDLHFDFQKDKVMAATTDCLEKARIVSRQAAFNVKYDLGKINEALKKDHIDLTKGYAGVIGDVIEQTRKRQCLEMPFLELNQPNKNQDVVRCVALNECFTVNPQISWANAEKMRTVENFKSTGSIKLRYPVRRVLFVKEKLWCICEHLIYICDPATKSIVKILKADEVVTSLMSGVKCTDTNKKLNSNENSNSVDGEDLDRNESDSSCEKSPYKTAEVSDAESACSLQSESDAESSDSDESFAQEIVVFGWGADSLANGDVFIAAGRSGVIWLKSRSDDNNYDVKAFTCDGHWIHDVVAFHTYLFILLEDTTTFRVYLRKYFLEDGEHFEVSKYPLDIDVSLGVSMATYGGEIFILSPAEKSLYKLENDFTPTKLYKLFDCPRNVSLGDDQFSLMIVNRICDRISTYEPSKVKGVPWMLKTDRDLTDLSAATRCDDGTIFVAYGNHGNQDGRPCFSLEAFKPVFV